MNEVLKIDTGQIKLLQAVMLLSEPYGTTSGWNLLGKCLSHWLTRDDSNAARSSLGDFGPFQRMGNPARRVPPVCPGKASSPLPRMAS